MTWGVVFDTIQWLMALPCSKGCSCPLWFKINWDKGKIGFILLFQSMQLPSVPYKFFKLCCCDPVQPVTL